jgi:hypothetical protein
MEQAHRHGHAAAGPEIEIEHLSFDFAGRGIERGEERRAFAGDNIGQLERAHADLRQVMIEPGRQRGIEIDDVARAIDREEAGRRVIEIVDGVLQFLEHVFLALALARHVSDRPHRHPRVAFRRPERTHAHAQPARRSSLGVGDAHLFLQPAALARGLEQAIDRLGQIGVADKHLLDRPHVMAVGGADQVEIGGIGVEHPAAVVGDQDAVKGVVDHRLEQRIAVLFSRKPHDAGSHGEQRKHTHGAQHRQ